MDTSIDTGMDTAADNGPRSAEEQRHVDIDAAGDLFLVVGLNPKYAFRVSSKVMSTASEVFRTMFGPNFMEGDALGQTCVNARLPR